MSEQLKLDDGLIVILAIIVFLFGLVSIVLNPFVTTLLTEKWDCTQHTTVGKSISKEYVCVQYTRKDSSTPVLPE